MNDMRFTKMHGCGNDYIYIDGTREHVENKSELAIRLSDRHFGIGGDGAIFINQSDLADYEMEMYNADGSRGKMCGNGIRCVARYLYDHGMISGENVRIESYGSVKDIRLNIKDGEVKSVCVDMGQPILEAAMIPADPSATMEGADEKGRLINVTYAVAGRNRKMTAVSMGNPHAVIFCQDIDQLELDRKGHFFEHSRVFPEGVNTEFVQICDRNNFKMRVWERGSGETYACGTGACASLVAAVLNGKTDRKVTVHLLGGDLEIEWNASDNHIYMTGPTVTVFTGEVEL